MKKLVLIEWTDGSNAVGLCKRDIPGFLREISNQESKTVRSAKLYSFVHGGLSWESTYGRAKNV